MGWTVHGSNPSGAEIFHYLPEWPWCPPNLLDSGDCILLGGKAVRALHWNPPPSSPEVKERVELYFYFPSSVLEWTLLNHVVSDWFHKAKSQSVISLCLQHLCFLKFWFWGPEGAVLQPGSPNFGCMALWPCFILVSEHWIKIADPSLWKMV